MPQIREYIQTESASGAMPQTRRANESDFGGPGMYRLGDSLMNAGQQLSQATTALNHARSREEVTDVHTQLAKANADWTVHLNDRVNSAAPGDETFAPKFLQDFDNYLSALGDKYETPAARATWARGVAGLKGQFKEQAFGQAARLGGVYAKQQFQSAIDASRNALVNDPSQFHTLLTATTAALDDPNSTYARIPAEQRAPLARMAKEQLAESTVQGYIKLSPELAIRQINSGNWDQHLDADKKIQLLRAAEVEGNRREAEVVRTRKEEQIATQEAVIQKLAAGKLTATDILNSNLAPTGDGSKEHFLNVLRTRSKEITEAPIKTIPSVMLDLFSRIHAPNGDPRKITNEAELNNAYTSRRLSFEDFNRLRKEVADARTPDGEKLGKRRSDFVNGISAQIDKSNPLMGKIDASGKQQVYEFSYYVDQQMEAYRKAGKNPYDLFDPSKPDYLGKPEVIAGFQKTMAQSMADYSASLRRQPGAVAPEKARKPGESVAQYLERTGSK